MKPKIARYVRRGYTMSRRARISHQENQHPVTYWIKELALDKETIKRMLIYTGIHHTGLYAQRTGFYRLPSVTSEKELSWFSRGFNSVPATKKKFINYIFAYLNESCQKYQVKMPAQLKQKFENLNLKISKPKTENSEASFNHASERLSKDDRMLQVKGVYPPQYIRLSSLIETE